MKFEKFLKGCGYCGLIVNHESGEKWLTSGGVGMKIPDEVLGLVVAGEVSEKLYKLVDEIITSNEWTRAELSLAYLPKNGKASDIIRIYSTGFSETGIREEAYKLLDDKDINLAVLDFADIEGTENHGRYLLVLDDRDKVIGFIRSINEG